MEHIKAFKTQDGKIFESEETAVEHEFTQMMMERLDAFSLHARCPYPDGVANTQMRKSIIAWEVVSRNLNTRADSVGTLDLLTRTLNCLKVENINTIGELLQCTENDLLKGPNMGRKSLNDVKEALRLRGLKLAGIDA
ncbi:DNA-directed RNA polymerase subunit alpha C-terminal domain-containing protein [Polaromonas sp.]|uniref:DNA-directed RNA polymerase subunit alpha C-terminal domain-containing protein n=1 Tax=Polaromonas sp. TaxID=1869339 RepID=UPI00356131E4